MSDATRERHHYSQELEYRDADEIEDAHALFAPKWYLMGFPKAGTHLLVSMFRPFAAPMPPTQLHRREWVGTFDHHSWSTEWLDIERQMYFLGQTLPGRYHKGHCGYTPELERFLYYLGVAFVFIYRDLRDVCVSQMHHCRDENDKLTHDDKEMYRAMSEEDALSAVITGIDKPGGGRYAGVLERWRFYAPWLDVDWIYPFRFEDAITDLEGTAERIVEYGIKRLATIFGLQVRAPGPGLAELVKQMADAARDTGQSATFRKGTSGQWREVFTEHHKRLFKEADRDNWLIRLGYETSNDW